MKAKQLFFILSILFVPLVYSVWHYSPPDSKISKTGNSKNSTNLNLIHKSNQSNALLKPSVQIQDETIKNTNPQKQKIKKSKNLKSKLIDNWDLKEIPIDSKSLEPFFADSQPAKIIYFDTHTTKQIYPKKYAEGAAQSDKILYLSNKDYIDTLSTEQSSFLKNHFSNLPSHSNLNKELSNKKHLPEDAFEIISFYPGTRNDGSVIVPVAQDYRKALDGPDYSFANIPASDDQKMLANLQTVLPLGNSGKLILQISDNGFIESRNGIDFTVYQTTFAYFLDDTQVYWHKFASIGVSNTLDPTQVQWFPCNPEAGDIKHCVGTHTTKDGGDQFSLAEIGLTQAKYIWIQDLGNNGDISSKWPTEGCALDAIRIHHAYTNQ